MGHYASEMGYNPEMPIVKRGPEYTEADVREGIHTAVAQINKSITVLNDEIMGLSERISSITLPVPSDSDPNKSIPSRPGSSLYRELVEITDRITYATTTLRMLRSSVDL